MKTQVKICGLTSIEDAVAAVEAGADLLGFNFYPPSPRYVTPMACAHMRGALARRGLNVVTVGVFVNMPPEEIRSIMDDCGLDLAQLSGDEPLDDLHALDGRAFKALRPQDAAQAMREASRYARSGVPALLLDAHHAGLYGGTGQTGDWALVASLVQQYPLLLAGGLNPENVGQAVRQVRPWGVDVASGVEGTPGKKDLKRMIRFIEAVRKFDKEENHVD